ncbi:EthD domain-containing protein [Rhizobium sp. K15/93]|uniref:EthD domain-containing protein n=1 Tax=Rhizobium sp. K15/93 TaxID=2819996 RepID=UPI001FFE0F92|nr:EthD domain-containing protein [Rhizobium sp. K15/93]
MFGGDGLRVLTAGQEAGWDAVALVRYPSRSAFRAMVSDPENQAAFKIGVSAISDIVLQPLNSIGGLV